MGSGERTTNSSMVEGAGRVLWWMLVRDWKRCHMLVDGEILAEALSRVPAARLGDARGVPGSATNTFLSYAI